MPVAPDPLLPASSQHLKHGHLLGILIRGPRGSKQSGTRRRRSGRGEGAYLHNERSSPKKAVSVVVGMRQIPIVVNKLRETYHQSRASEWRPTEGTLFEHNGRVACGSSLLFSGENYSGTFGAIVRKKKGGDMHILSNNHILAACNHTPVRNAHFGPQ